VLTILLVTIYTYITTKKLFRDQLLVIK